ncbi:hypothetical protein ZWY2020_001476 [Hordeum vulgare]|nr:hypothetical protein ZWY2020_001476 [Hordeum vulgare]
MFGDGGRMQPERGQFVPAEGGGGELAAASREGSSVSDPAWAYGANANKRKAPSAGAAKGKEAAATFAKALRDKKLKGQLAGKEKIIGISAKAAAQAEKWFLPVEGGYLEPEGLEKT